MNLAASAIARWIDDPPADTALHVLSRAGGWERHPYQDLARRTRAAAHGLRAHALRNDCVLVVAPPGPDFVAVLYATLFSGGTVSIAAPPLAFEAHAAWAERLGHVIAIAAPRLVLTPASLVPALTGLALPGIAIVAIEDLRAAGADGAGEPWRTPADVALLQFTSGSSRHARGVRVPFDALEANVAAIRVWLEWSASDGSAFWVPQYHDMGLLGGLIAPLTSGGDVWLMTPDQFVRRPLEYLRCFGERGARLTALPAFGLDYVVRRVAAGHLSGLDFSNVKAFVVGAELIDPDVLVRFERLLAPAGLRPGRVLPAYGLAEATLAVTGAPLGQRWTSRVPSSGGRPFVSCGRPLAGVGIAVVDESGRAVADGTVGEIVCRGESVAAGYAGAADEASNAAFSGGTLQTGDAGFLAEGDLFPIGRMGDSLKVRGTALFAEHLESALHAAGYAREHNVVLLGLRDGRPAIVWISESASRVDHAMVGVLQRLGEGAPVWCVLAARGAILRTSSGKPRRRVLWSDFIRGRISAKVSEPLGWEAHDHPDD